MRNPPLRRDRGKPHRGNQAHRRSLGRGGGLPGRLVSRPPLVGMERQVPRRRPISGEANRDGRGPGEPHLGQRRHLSEGRQRAAEQINFVTCHDGFTLNDLVSYNEKHNEANGEGKRRHELELQL